MILHRKNIFLLKLNEIKNLSYTLESFWGAPKTIINEQDTFFLPNKTYSISFITIVAI
jgi:hypothetical protein